VEIDGDMPRLTPSQIDAEAERYQDVTYPFSIHCPDKAKLCRQSFYDGAMWMQNLQERTHEGRIAPKPNPAPMKQRVQAEITYKGTSIKPKELSVEALSRIYHIILFSSGQVMCFDEIGEQVAEVQLAFPVAASLDRERLWQVADIAKVHDFGIFDGGINTLSLEKEEFIKLFCL